MKKNSLYRILKKKQAVGLLCNQSAWDPETGKYRFLTLAESGRLRTVFVPEHGLFGELQDQVKLNETAAYRQLEESVSWVSLYGTGEDRLTATADQLAGLDLLVIDLQDTGSRYYTYVTTVFLLLKKITELRLDLTVYVIDRPNPAGRTVEGTRLPEDYSSFIGLAGLPHRHGLTIGELCRYFQHRLSGSWALMVEPARKKALPFIAPSPNIPAIATCQLYSGQCLWEGTNLSEGRGTTQPFATVGAPFLNWVFTEDWNHRRHPGYHQHCRIRPLLFQPVFHKYAGEVCQGIQLMVEQADEYHSLAHTLQLMRYIRAKTPGFGWRSGPYEAFSKRPAIELLAGDPLMLDYLNGTGSWEALRSKMNDEERAWIREASPFLLYKQPLQKPKIK